MRVHGRERNETYLVLHVTHDFIPILRDVPAREDACNAPTPLRRCGGHTGMLQLQREGITVSTDRQRVPPHTSMGQQRLRENGGAGPIMRLGLRP